MDQHKGVPRLSLKHFAGPDGMVWTYSKETGRRWAARPERTGVEAHYYSVEQEDGSMDTRLETLMALLEGEAAPVYEGLAAGEMPKGSDRDTFGYFLGLLFVRSPSMLRMAAKVHKFGIENRFAFAAQHEASFEQLLRRMAASGIDVSDPEFIRRSLVDLSHSNLLLPKVRVLKSMARSYEFAHLFLRMKWSLANAGQHYFITGDTPIYWVVDPKTVHPSGMGNGLINKTVEVTFPISTKRLLILHWEWEGSAEAVMPREYVRKENGKRAHWADQEVYAHVGTDALQRLVNKHKGTRQDIEAAGMAEKGFGEVKVPRRWASAKKGG